MLQRVNAMLPCLKSEGFMVCCKVNTMIPYQKALWYVAKSYCQKALWYVAELILWYPKTLWNVAFLKIDE